MPDFDFTAPDGKQYTVSGPDGATPEQAFQILQSQLKSGPAASSNAVAVDPNENIPAKGSIDYQIASPEKKARYDQIYAQQQAGYVPPKPAGLGDKLVGAGEAALSTVSGLTTGLVGGVAGGIAGAVGNLTNGAYGNSDGVEAGIGAGMQGMTYTPRTQKGQEYAQNVGDAVQASGVQGLPIGPELAAIGSLAGPAARQAGNAARNSTEVYIAQKLAEKAGNIKLTPKIDQERAQLAQKAADIGIEAPLHTLTDNKYVRMAGEFLDNLPLSGSTKADNEAAFNKSLIGQIGGDAQKFSKLTPTVFSEALAKSGKAIGEVFNKIEVPFADEALQSDLSSLRGTLPRVLSDTEKVVVGYMDELSRLAAGNDGKIPGKSLKALHSEVLKDLRGRSVDNYPGMRERLSDFQSILEDAADRQITSPDDKAKYQTARVQYAKAKTIEPLVARGGINGVSPQGLLGQLNSTSMGKHRMATGAAGELGDLAQIAQNFMKEQPSSGTAERSAVIGAVMAPIRAVGGMVAGNLYNRVARPVARAAVRNSLDDAVPPVRFPVEPLGFADEPTFAPRSAPVNDPYSGIIDLVDKPNDYKYSSDNHSFMQDRPRPEVEGFSTSPDVPSVDFPSFETQPMPIQRSGERPTAAPQPSLSAAYDGGIDYYGNQPAPAAAPVADSGLMSLAEPVQPQPVQAPQSFPNAGGNAIDFPLRQEVLQGPNQKAMTQAFVNESKRLRDTFYSSTNPDVRAQAQRDIANLDRKYSEQIGVRNPQEAIGLQNLYEAGSAPRMEVKKTFDPRASMPPEVRQRVNAERTRLKLQAIGDATTVDEAIRAASE